MIEEYPDDKDVEYNIDMCSLHKIKESLIEKLLAKLVPVPITVLPENVTVPVILIFLAYVPVTLGSDVKNQSNENAENVEIVVFA